MEIVRVEEKTAVIYLDDNCKPCVKICDTFAEAREYQKSIAPVRQPTIFVSETR